MFGFHAFSAAPFSSTVSSGPAAFEPELEGVAAATVNPLVITPDFGLDSIQPVTFGAMYVPSTWAPELTAVLPVTMSRHMSLVRFTAKLPRKTIFRLSCVRPVRFGTPTLP